MILVRLKGGLGNQMFQYAAAKALAVSHNTTVVFDLTLLNDRTPIPGHIFRAYELQAFNLSSNFATNKIIEYYNPKPGSILKRIYNRIKRLLINPLVYIEPSHRYDSTFTSLADNCCIIGTFQSEKYFRNIEDIIRHDFKFVKQFESKVELLADLISQKNAVCLHVRRGDYISSALYNKLLGAKNKEYYQEGVELMLSKLDNIELYIFSDDIEWCKQNLKFDLFTTYITDEIATTDHHAQLYLMSKCKHFIISNSTFSWWGAWLSGYDKKVVIAPKLWFSDGSKDAKDIIPNGWIKI